MKVENITVYDLDESIKASKYPMAIDTDACNFDITNTVKGLGSSEQSAGHNQFLTGILVSFDLTFSNKAWVEAERYRFLNFVSSQSTMHRITKLDIKKQCNKYVWYSTIDKLKEKVKEYNLIENKNSEKAKELYLEILYNVPSGFELTARLTTNYRCLRNIYFQRRNHRLPEWREFCKWIETLPYFKELCLNNLKSKEETN